MVKRLAAAVLMVLGLPVLAGAQWTLAPQPKFLGLDANRDPVVSGKLCTYTAGTTTPATTYVSSSGAANANPVVLDGAGQGDVWLVPGQSYKFVLRTAGSSPLECTTGTIQWTVDNIGAVPTTSNNVDILGTAGEALTAGQVVYLSDGSGGKTAGSWYKGDSSNTYSSTLPSIGMVPASITSGASGSIRLAGAVTGLTSLSVGSTYYVGTAGAITSTGPTNRRIVGIADTTSSLVLFPALPAIANTSTITTTGTQTALALPSGSGNLTIFANNATALTLQGITAGLDGQSLDIVAIGAGQVDLNDQNGSASAANRIVTGLSATLSLTLGQGRARLVYDATAARWRVQAYAPGSANAVMEGLSFPAVQVASSGANVLDDYEEGPWTPSDGSGAALSFSAVVAQYVKIGQLVTATASITFPATGSGANATIAGLPFTSNSSGTAIYGCSVSYTTESTLRALNIQPNALTALAYDFSGVLITNATLTTDVIRFTCVYRAAQ